jgi:hypothetical protein
MRYYPKVMKMGNNSGTSYAIVIHKKLVEKYDLDKEPHLMLEGDEEFDGKHLFHIRKIKLD